MGYGKRENIFLVEFQKNQERKESFYALKVYHTYLGSRKQWFLLLILFDNQALTKTILELLTTVTVSPVFRFHISQRLSQSVFKTRIQRCNDYENKRFLFLSLNHS